MVFSKRVIDRLSFCTYPYGYYRWHPGDEEMCELLLDL